MTTAHLWVHLLTLLIGSTLGMLAASLACVAGKSDADAERIAADASFRTLNTDRLDRLEAVVHDGPEHALSRQDNLFLIFALRNAWSQNRDLLARMVSAEGALADLQRRLREKARKVSA